MTAAEAERCRLDLRATVRAGADRFPKPRTRTASTSDASASGHERAFGYMSACRPRLSWHVAGCGQTRTDQTVGEPDSEVVEWCSPFEIEQESRNRRLTWGGLDVSLRGNQDGTCAWRRGASRVLARNDCRTGCTCHDVSPRSVGHNYAHWGAWQDQLCHTVTLLTRSLSSTATAFGAVLTPLIRALEASAPNEPQDVRPRGNERHARRRRHMVIHSEGRPDPGPRETTERDGPAS